MVRSPRASISLLILSGCLFLSTGASSQTLVQPLSIYKTSFNCAGIQQQTAEEAVCHHEKLAALDVEMANAYQKRLAAAGPAEREVLVHSQREWLTIRNMHRFYGKLSDQEGMVSDLADFYQERIAALQSKDLSLLEPKLPPEYEWLKSTVPSGFLKEAFLVREYMGCEDACKRKTALYRVVGMWGDGIGDPPGDTRTPYTSMLNKLQKDGWKQCRKAIDDSGKIRVDYFTKQEKMLALSSYYSMGAGNSIQIEVTVSAPLAEPLETRLNPRVEVTSDWKEYKSADGILSVKYPPRWSVRNDARPETNRKKDLLFTSDDYAGDFRLIIEEHWYPPGDRECVTSPYRIDGEPAQACLVSIENVGVADCYRYIESINANKDGLHVSFWPGIGGSFVDDFKHFMLTHLYETILNTISVK